MSEVDSRFVKEGLWTDLEKGAVMGKTITTDTQTGAFVIALLAILSSLATAHLWHLVTFFIHQIRANGRPRDALFRQQQAILRTLPTPGALIADSLKLFWHWKSKKGAWHAWVRVTLLALLAALFVAMTWTASIFSSLAVDTTQLRVLVSSPNCGGLNLTFENLNDIGLSYITQVLNAAEPFADSCYIDRNQSQPGLCDALIRPKTLFTTESVECPWDATMCVGEEKPAVRMDSGLIDLNDFGLNLAPKDRVQFRKSTTCAVLPLENHTMVIPAADFPELNRPPIKDEEVVLLFYGDVIHYESWINATFYCSLAESNTTNRFESGVMTAAGNEAWYEYGSMITLPEMQNNATDMVYRAIAKNYVMYREPIDDPVFAAHRTNPTISSAGLKLNSYYADDPVTVVTCAQQYQFCIAQGKGDPYCTELNALPERPTKENFPQASDIQLAALQLLVNTGALIDQGSSKSFDAEKYQWSGEIISLPANQWIKEVTRWETIAWSGIHHLITDYAIGPNHRDPSADSYTIKPDTAGMKQLCQAQRMRKNGGFVNINFFALVFVITFSLVVVVLDITLLKILIFLSGFRRLTGLTQPLSRWTQDGVLQLQRRAYEAQGIRHWENLDDDVPLIHPKRQLGDLLVESMPPTGVVVNYDELKKPGDVMEHEEEFSPRRLRSAKTWATQDTLFSIDENMSGKSSSKDSPPLKSAPEESLQER